MFFSENLLEKHCWNNFNTTYKLKKFFMTLFLQSTIYSLEFFLIYNLLSKVTFLTAINLTT